MPAPAPWQPPVAPPPAAAADPHRALRAAHRRAARAGQSAGLEWVNSDAEKIRAVQEAMAAEPPAGARAARAAAAQVLVDEGPLVLVETRKDLSQLKLPFEASAG